MSVNTATNQNYFKKGLWQYVMHKTGPKSLTNDGSLTLESLKNRLLLSGSSQPEPDGSQAVPSTPASIITTTLTSIQAAGPPKSVDSIGNEMTHFKPIRMMPISGQYSSEKELIIPIVRYTEIKTNKSVLQFAPAKSKFKPESPLKVRNSAFCLVPRAAVSVMGVVPFANKRSTRNSHSIVAAAETTAVSIAALTKTTTTTTTTSSSYSVYNRNKSKQKLMCSLPTTTLPKSDKILLQEKHDYELAKMLQEYDDNDTEPISCQRTNGRCHDASVPFTGKLTSNRTSNEGTSVASTVAADHLSHSMASDISKTRRYFLRSRSKPQAASSVPASPAVKLNGSVRKVAATNGNRSKTKAPLVVVMNGRVEKKVGRRRKR